MRYLLIAVLALFLLGCDGCDIWPDNKPMDVYGEWDANPPIDSVAYYRVFWWQGNDTTGITLSFVDTVNHYYGYDSVVTSPAYSIIYDYVILGVTAVDIDSLQSDMAVSRLYTYSEFFAPRAPVKVRISKTGAN